MTVLHFLPHILSLFIDRFFLVADHEQIPANSAYLYLQYDVAFFQHIITLLLFMERFVCNLHAYAAYLQYMKDTGLSKIRQEFWGFRVSGLNK
jgi:phage/plasmid-associated DNA primase